MTGRDPLAEGVRKTAHRIRRLGPAAPFIEQAAQRGLVFLHVGCGPLLVPKWINCDVLTIADPDGRATTAGEAYELRGSLYIHIDPARPYPVPDGKVAWVYSEHLIEHLSLRAGLAWLREMRRVLTQGGRIRISTPDLEQFSRGYLDKSRALLTQWRQDLIEYGESKSTPARPAFLFNTLMRSWGHQYLYDFAEMSTLLTHAGFANVVRQTYRNGQDAALAKLDQKIRSAGNLYVEATKP